MEIRPAEISEILKAQISGFDAEANVAEVGTVLTVGDGIARGAHAVDLGVDFLGLDEVVGDIDAARHHQHRAPDGDATCDRETMDGEGHARTGGVSGRRAAITRLRRTCR